MFLWLSWDSKTGVGKPPGIRMVRVRTGFANWFIADSDGGVLRLGIGDFGGVGEATTSERREEESGKLVFHGDGVLIEMCPSQRALAVRLMSSGIFLDPAWHGPSDKNGGFVFGEDRNPPAAMEPSAKSPALPIGSIAHVSTRMRIFNGGIEQVWAGAGIDPDRILSVTPGKPEFPATFQAAI